MKMERIVINNKNIFTNKIVDKYLKFLTTKTEKDEFANFICQKTINSNRANSALLSIAQDSEKLFNSDSFHFVFINKGNLEVQIPFEYPLVASLSGLNTVNLSKNTLEQLCLINEKPLFLESQMMNETYSELISALKLRKSASIVVNKVFESHNTLILMVFSWENLQKNLSSEDYKQIIDFSKTYIFMLVSSFFIKKTSFDYEKELIISEINEFITKTIDISQINSFVINKLAEYLKPDRCFIRIYDNEIGEFTKIDEFSEYIESEDVLSVVDYSFSKEVDELVMNNYKANESIIIPDLNDLTEHLGSIHPIIKAMRDLFDVKSSYSFPVLDNGILTGLLIIHYTKEKTVLSNENIDFVRTIVKELGMAMSKAILYLKSQRLAERERMSRTIISLIRNTIDLDELLKHISKELGRAFNVHRSTIVKVEEFSKFAEWTVVNETLADEKYPTAKDLENKDVIGKFWINKYHENKGSVVVIDIENSQELPPKMKEEYVSMGMKTIVGIPIIKHDDLWGGIFLSSYNQPRLWDKYEIDTLITIRDQIYVAIKQAELYKKLLLQSERQNVLYSIVSEIRDSLDLENTFLIIARYIADIFDVHRITIGDINNELDEHSFFKEYKVNVRYKGVSDIRKNKVKALWQKVLGSNYFVIVEDINKSIHPDYFKKFYEDLEVKSLIAFGLRFDSGLNGYIVISDHHRARRWSEDEKQLLMTIVDHLSIAMNQSMQFKELKLQLEKEKAIRDDASILVNRDLASNVGLESALTYSLIANKYSQLRDEGKLDENDYYNETFEYICSNTFLKEETLRESMEQLKKSGLIDYNEFNKRTIHVKVNDNLILKKKYFTYSSPENNTVIDNPVLSLPNAYYDINQLKATFQDSFSSECINAVEHYLVLSNKSSNISKLTLTRQYYAVLLRTFHDFMQLYKLGGVEINSLINNWFIAPLRCECPSVVNFGLSNRLLASRLKKILIYRLQELQILASDVSSKMDFYLTKEFEQLDFENNPCPNNITKLHDPQPED